MSKHKSEQAAKPHRHKSTAAQPETLAPESEQRAASPSSVADASRQKMIAEAAYYRAEKRGFEPGREVDDWLEAEAEITQLALEEEPAAAELH
jgi:hypothetical protein